MRPLSKFEFCRQLWLELCELFSWQPTCSTVVFKFESESEFEFEFESEVQFGLRRIEWKRKREQAAWSEAKIGCPNRMA